MADGFPVMLVSRTTGGPHHGVVHDLARENRDLRLSESRNYGATMQFNPKTDRAGMPLGRRSSVS
jgi:hypothetical protein